MANINLNNLQGIPFGIDSGRPANPQPGQPYFNGQSNRLEIYTQTVGWQNIVQETPAVVNVVGTANENASSTITVNGTNFAVGCIAYAVGTNGVETQATTTTLVSVVQLTAVFPALSPTYEPYDIKVVNPSNLYGVLYDCLTVDNIPAWTTASGSLGTYIEQSPMSVTVSATDPVDPLSSPLIYSIVSGALPGGLSINASTGVISGTPTDIIANTTYTFTAGAYDGRNPAVTRNFSITITDRGPSWSTSATLPTFTQGSAYSTTLVATDDNGIASYSLFSGSLPTGLSLNGTTGVISGTPTGSTSATFTIRATDNGGSYVDRQFTMPNVGPSWSTSATLPTFTRNSAYSTTVVATDDSGSTPTYSIVSGSLPTGLTLNSATGVISGTPTSSNTASFTLRATDANGTAADRAFTMPNAVPVWTTSGTITPIGNGSAYSYQLVATDDSGVAPTYSLVSGTLPTGISVSSSGLISGTASGITSSTGTLSITFRATDVNGGYADRTLNIPTALYAFSTFTFTPAGVTGRYGPTLAQVQSAYSSTSWAQNTSYLNVTTQGIQSWVPPTSGVYEIECVGAQGGPGNDNSPGGYGAKVIGRFTLSTSNTYNIVVGQSGAGQLNGSTYFGGSGGGGSFVYTGAIGSNGLLIAAGGGGGGPASPNNLASSQSQANANYSGTSGNTISAFTYTASGGTNGYGGYYSNRDNAATNSGGPGAGWYSDGQLPAGSTATYTAIAGTRFTGGTSNGTGQYHGGWGGGAASGNAAGAGGASANNWAGGGGGYSGGGAGFNSGQGDGQYGGGGGSYNSGTNQSSSQAASGQGYVKVTYIG